MAKLLKKTFGLGGKKPPMPPKPDYKPGQLPNDFDEDHGYREGDDLFSESPPAIRSSNSPTSPGSFTCDSHPAHPPAIHPRTTSSPQGVPPQNMRNILALDCNKAPILLTDYSEPVDMKKTPVGKCSVQVGEYTEPYDVCGDNPTSPDDVKEKMSPTQEDFRLYDDPENCNLDDVENFEQFEEYPNDERPKEDYEDPWEWSMKNRVITKIQNMAEQESAELESAVETKKTHCEIDVGYFNSDPPPIGCRLSQSKTEEDLSSTQKKPAVEFSSDECIYAGNYEDPWDLDKMTEKLENRFKAANKDKNPASTTLPTPTKTSLTPPPPSKTMNVQGLTTPSSLKSRTEPQEPAIPKGFLHDVLSSIDSQIDDKKPTRSYFDDDIKPKGKSKKNKAFKKQHSSPNPVTSFTLERPIKIRDIDLDSAPSTPPQAVEQTDEGPGQYEEPWDLRSKLRSAQFLQAAEKFMNSESKTNESEDAESSATSLNVEENEEPGQYEEPWDLRSKFIPVQLIQAAGGVPPKEHQSPVAVQKDHHSSAVVQKDHHSPILVQKDRQSPVQVQKEYHNQHSWTRPPPDRPPPPIPSVPPPTTKPPSPPPPMSTAARQRQDREREKLNLELAKRASCFGEGFDPNLPLDKQIWYHGNIGRVEAENLLRVHKEGSYLVRNSESSKQDFSLSLKSARGFMHMKIVYKDNTYILGQFSQPYSSIPEMIYHYRMHKLPIKGAEHMSLLFPVVNELL